MMPDLEEGDALELPPPETELVIKTNQKLGDFYDILEELGKGKFGVVKKCRNKTTGEIYAAKYVRKTKQTKVDVTNEIIMMGKVHHKRLVRLQDAFETSDFMILVMELVTGGELFEKVVEEDNLTEKQVVRYMRQVLFAVQHMHRKSIVHLDLKPENILCVGGEKAGYEELKLIDFGMARILEPGKKVTAAQGTPEFVAPEVISLDPISLAADMWSIGAITYVLMSGLSPFMGENDSETLTNVSNAEWDFDDGEGIFEQISDEGKRFIEELLILEPGKRNTVDDCLEHEWCKKTQREKKLKVDKLKKFIARRRWQRGANALKAVRRLESLTMLRKSPSVSPSISPSTSVAKLTDEVAINSSNGNNHQNKTTNAVNSDENHSSTSEMNKENNEKVVNHEEETGSSSHDETAAAPLVNNVDGNSDENEDGGITMKVNKSKPEIPVLEVNDIVASNDDVS